MNNIKPQIHKLNNGARIITNSLPFMNAISVNLRVGAGTRVTPKAKAGLPHLVEHLLFAGTRTRPSSKILNSDIEKLGGGLDGGTHVEYASYWLDIPYQNFFDAMPIFLDMIQNPLFDKDNLDKEKAIILDEIEEDKDSGWSLAEQMFLRALWSNQSINISTLGSASSIKGININDINDFYEKFYCPENIVMAVTGNVEHEKVVDFVQGVWEGGRKKKARREMSISKDINKLSLVRCNRDFNLVYLTLGFIIPRMDDSLFGAYMILNNLLGGGMSSLLYTKLRDEYALCYSIDSNIEIYKECSILSVNLAVKPDNLLKALYSLLNIINELRSNGVSLEQFELFRKMTLGHETIKLDEVGSHSWMLSVSTFLTGKTISLNSRINQIAKTRLEDVRLAAESLHYLSGSFVGPINAYVWKECKKIVEAFLSSYRGFMEKCFVLLRPEVIMYGFYKDIITLIQTLPAEIVASKETMVTSKQIEKLYSRIDLQEWLPEIVSSHLKGPCVLLILRGEGICKQTEELGNQIRKKYGLDKLRNCIHTSDNNEMALIEISIFFRERACDLIGDRCMINKIIAIEGICCSGKTTLIKNLSKLKNIVVVPEGTTIVKDFPPPPNNKEEVKRNEAFCIEVEILRSSLAKRFHEKVQTTLLDRSVFSIISIAYGYSPIFGEYLFEDLVQRCIYEINTGSIAIPQAFIYLDLPITMVNARNESRENFLSDFWVGEETLMLQKKFYEIWMDTIPSDRVCRIDASECENVVFEKGYRFINSLNDVEVEFAAVSSGLIRTLKKLRGG